MKISIVLTLCHRISNFYETLSAINNQTVEHDLIILAQSEEAVSTCTDNGLGFIKGETSMPSDRFNWAKEQTEYDAFLFIDDDMIIDKDFLEVNLKHLKEDQAVGWWAWNFDEPKNKYFSRTQPKTGELAELGGGGGLLVHKNFIKQISHCPDTYGMVDDIWFAREAARLGLRIVKGEGNIEFINSKDDNALWRSLQGGLKGKYYRELLKPYLVSVNQ